MKHIHGTIRVPGKHHPVLDIDKWIQRFPFDPARIRFDGRPSSPGGVAFFEQARKLAGEHGDLGPSVPVDMFTWSDRSGDPGWLTKIGGSPWREKHKPWPKAPDGTYLTFLGQLCFANSKDLFPFELPGDVTLIFGKYFPVGCTTCEGYALEWSNIELDKPLDYFGEFGTELPFCYRGVIHRTVQYTDHKQHVPRFEDIGGSWDELSGEVQATCIGARAMLPQGWPFMEGDGNTLVGVLSGISIGGDWPLCDMPESPKSLHEDGELCGAWNSDAMNFTIGDCGSIYIYRDKRGRFRLEEATH